MAELETRALISVTAPEAHVVVSNEAMQDLARRWVESLNVTGMAVDLTSLAPTADPDLTWDPVEDSDMPAPVLHFGTIRSGQGPLPLGVVAELAGALTVVGKDPGTNYRLTLDADLWPDARVENAHYLPLYLPSGKADPEAIRLAQRMRRQRDELRHRALLLGTHHEELLQLVENAEFGHMVAGHAQEWPAIDSRVQEHRDRWVQAAQWVAAAEHMPVIASYLNDEVQAVAVAGSPLVSDREITVYLENRTPAELAAALNERQRRPGIPLETDRQSYVRVLTSGLVPESFLSEVEMNVRDLAEGAPTVTFQTPTTARRLGVAEVKRLGLITYPDGNYLQIPARGVGVDRPSFFQPYQNHSNPPQPFTLQ